MSAAEPIRDDAHISAIVTYFLTKKEYRNYLLIIMGINTALRISDLLRLRWCDVYDFKHKNFKPTLCIVEKKTKKNKIIALNHNVQQALYLNLRNIGVNYVRKEMPLFPNTQNNALPISRFQAYGIIKFAGERIGLRLSCHSLRKTFGYYATRNGASLAVIMKIYNHSSSVLTLRYLGITQEDQNQVYHDMAMFLPT
jgi:integrase